MAAMPGEERFAALGESIEGLEAQVSGLAIQVLSRGREGRFAVDELHGSEGQDGDGRPMRSGRRRSRWPTESSWVAISCQMERGRGGGRAEWRLWRASSGAGAGAVVAGVEAGTGEDMGVPVRAAGFRT